MNDLIKRLRDVQYQVYLDGDVDMYGLLGNAATALEQRAQEWISVKDRLPELHTKVLCCGVKGGRFIAETSEWGEGHLYWTKRDGKGCSEVTHWMPLPQPPKGE